MPQHENFQKSATDLLTQTVTAYKNKDHLKSLQDLDQLVKTMNSVVTQMSKGEYGVGLTPANHLLNGRDSEATGPDGKPMRWYGYMVTKKHSSGEMRAHGLPVILFATQFTGAYPMFWLTGEQLAGIMDKTALEELILGAFRPPSPLVKILGELP